MQQIYFGTRQQTYGTTIETPSTSSTIKAISFIIILMAISLFSIQFSSALDFSFNTPASAESGEPFTTSISASVSSTYDVKIFIQDENKNIVSEIFNGEWKNPYYFLKSAFPAQTEFKIRSLNASGNYKICARLRESGKTSFTEKCNEIIIAFPPSSKKSEETPKETPEKEQSNNNEQDEETPPQEVNKSISQNSSASSSTQNLSYSSNKKISSNEKIILGSKPLNKEDSEVFTTKYETIRNFILYAFIAFCIVLIILLALKQL